MKKVVKPVADVVQGVEDTFDGALGQADKTIDPYRKSFARRYPTIFLLAVAFGVAAVAHGLTGLIEDVTLFADRPFLVLLCGVFILVVTGRLYKKLG